MSFFQLSSCPTTHGGIPSIIRTQVVPFHQRPVTAISLCSKRLRPIACMRRICPRNCSRIRPTARRASSSGEGMRTTRERLTMPTKIFAEPSAHHLRVELVVDLALALLIPVLRRNHVNSPPLLACAVPAHTQSSPPRSKPPPPLPDAAVFPASGKMPAAQTSVPAAVCCDQSAAPPDSSSGACRLLSYQ